MGKGRISWKSRVSRNPFIQVQSEKSAETVRIAAYRLESRNPFIQVQSEKYGGFKKWEDLMAET